MGDLLSKPKLSEFQKEKLLHEFHLFYDLDESGTITWEDFFEAKARCCKLNGWKIGSEKEKSCGKAFEMIWESLEEVGDKDEDGTISKDEWLALWEKVLREIREKKKKGMPEVSDLPAWCYEYLGHRFNLYDRTGDGVIDEEEFEYTLSHYSVSSTDARKAFLIFTESNSMKLDFAKFCELAVQYFFSNDPSALGNFITGKLDFESIQ